MPNVTRPSHRSSPRVSVAGGAGFDAIGTTTKTPSTSVSAAGILIAPITITLLDPRIRSPSVSALPADASARRRVPGSDALARPSTPAGAAAAVPPAAPPGRPVVPERVSPATPHAPAHAARRDRLAPGRGAPPDPAPIGVQPDDRLPGWGWPEELAPPPATAVPAARRPAPAPVPAKWWTVTVLARVPAMGRSPATRQAPI